MIDVTEDDNNNNCWLWTIFMIGYYLPRTIMQFNNNSTKVDLLLLTATSSSTITMHMRDIYHQAGNRILYGASPALAWLDFAITLLALDWLLSTRSTMAMMVVFVVYFIAVNG